MKTTRAVITAAARNQRTLPLQRLVDRDGTAKSVLQILVEEALEAGIESICVVVCPGDEAAYRDAAGIHAERLQFAAQPEPRGYGHAIWTARPFVGNEPFLHMVGDHIYIRTNQECSARQIVAEAEAHSCAVSGVQPTRENQLNLFGAVGGKRVQGTKHLYQIETVAEKPTPTEAEQTLLVPGLRAGHYLCFFGIHVFTPLVMQLLDEAVTNQTGNVGLSPVLNTLAQRERYLAVEAEGKRYPIDAQYGLFTAQLALGLSGTDRDALLTTLCELLAQK
jgi:UTP--glucose-1-phosphate uridylyltransferase